MGAGAGVGPPAYRFVWIRRAETHGTSDFNPMMQRGVAIGPPIMHRPLGRFSSTWLADQLGPWYTLHLRAATTSFVLAFLALVGSLQVQSLTPHFTAHRVLPTGYS